MSEEPDSLGAWGRTTFDGLAKEKVLGLPMNEKPQLVADASVRGEPIIYRCSACAQILLLPKDRTPKDAAAELLAAFNQHVQKKHSDGNRAGPRAGDRDVSSRAEEPREAQASGNAAADADSTSPGEMRTRKLIEAAYRISEEVGQELEAILKTGPSDENLASLHAKILKATRNRETAERVYSAIFSALHPP